MRKPIDINVLGFVANDGQPRIYAADEMQRFFSHYKGRKFSGSFTVLPDKQSDQLRAYYFSEIVSRYQEALYEQGNFVTKEDTHEQIKTYSPLMRVERLKGSKIETQRIRSVSELDTYFMRQYIEDLRIFGAINLNVSTRDPGEFINH